MIVPDPADPTGRLLLAALAAYSDACELPSLTPECPFYRRTLEGACCGDECRELLRRAGVDSGIREMAIGGLVLTGRVRRVNDRPTPFDARQQYLSDASLPFPERATGSLLLALADALDPSIDFDDAAIPHALEAELSRRGVDGRAVLITAALPDVAASLAALTLLPDLLASTGERNRVQETVRREAEQWSAWGPLLDAAIAGEGGEHAALRAAGRDSHVLLSALVAATPGREAPILVGALPTAGLPLGLSPASVVAHPRLASRLLYALSDRFLNRLHRWLASALPERLSDFDGWRPPDAVSFLAMPMEPLPARADEQWLWDRFTVTYTNDWRPSSLRREWEFAHGQREAPCHDETMAARSVPLTAIADAAMSRETSDPSPARPAGMATVDFVDIAVSRLRHGRAGEAVALFAGIAELRPEDAEARNNYGFCLLPSDAAAALLELEEAHRLGVQPALVNAANRVLALHLLGRDADALAIAREALAAGTRARAGAFLWWHDCDAGELRLQEGADARSTLLWLMEHIDRQA